MGFYSYKTSDMDIPIAADAADIGADLPVLFWVQPDGRAPIIAHGYRGFGRFGGVDVHDWIALENFPGARDLDRDTRIDIGVALESAEALVDAGGNAWCWLAPEPLKEAIGLRGFHHYMAPIDELGGRTPNDLVEEGVLTRIPLREHYRRIMEGRGALPGNGFREVKLTFDPDRAMDYDGLPAAEFDEHQGYFYGEEDADTLREQYLALTVIQNRYWLEPRGMSSFEEAFAVEAPTAPSPR